MVDVIVCGAAGRMGRSNIEGIFFDDGVRLLGAVESVSSGYLGKDAGILGGVGELGVEVVSDLVSVLSVGGVVIDFTVPVSSLEALSLNLDYKRPFVVGTTGFSALEFDMIGFYSKEFPIVLSPNFSIGVNVLFKLTELASSFLSKDRGYDLEVFEAHHRYKKDAPSGTALKLAELAADGSGRSFSEDLVYGRDGMVGERGIEEIGMLTMRGGDIVGDHKVSFCTLGERVELGHIAHSRQTFSRGAILASKWVSDRGVGLYSMRDVLSL